MLLYMSTSESKTVFEAWESKEIDRLPGFPDGVPKNIVVTDHAREAFDLARDDQGLIGIAWLGKDENNSDVLYLDLMPAFNKDDGKPITDKNNNPLVIGENCVYSYEKLGGNSGQNHMEFLKIIKARIEKAYEDNDEKTKKIYEGIIRNNKGKIEIDREKMFGFGVFKGNEEYILYQFRSVSANINFSSVKRNPEYLLINFFFPNKDINNPFQREYFLQRSIPNVIASTIKQALLDDFRKIPRSESSRPTLIKDCEIDHSQDYYQSEQKEWDTVVKNDPHLKINRLYETLCKFLGSKNLRMEKIKESVDWIKYEISLIEKTPFLQQAKLKAILESPSEYNGRNVFDIALSHNHVNALNYLNQQIQIPIKQNDSFYEELLNKLSEEKCDFRLLKVMLELGKLKSENILDINNKLLEKLPMFFQNELKTENLNSLDNIIKLLIVFNEHPDDQDKIAQVFLDLKKLNGLNVTTFQLLCTQYTINIDFTLDELVRDLITEIKNSNSNNEDIFVPRGGMMNFTQI